MGTTPPPTASNPLLGISALQHAFIFLDGPAEVLSASVACSRWRVLATADGLWRVKVEEEGMRAKAERWQVGVPGGARGGGLGGGGGEGGGGTGSDGEEKTEYRPGFMAALRQGFKPGDEGSGQVTMAVYRQIFVLKVRVESCVELAPLGRPKVLS